EVLHRVCRWWEIDFQLWHSFSEWDEWFSSIRLPGSVKGFLEGVFYVAWCLYGDFTNRVYCLMLLSRLDRSFLRILLFLLSLVNSRWHMALPVQNINHSAFRWMFEREKLSGNNFNDWYRQLKLVLRVEKKLFVIEQPLPAASAADSKAQVLAQWNAVYDAYNEVVCLILGSMTPERHIQFENSSSYEMIKELKSMFEKQARVERFDLI
ncbi:hypothetical protein Tco_0979273, partial [Tanacetum coccineum]